MDAEIKAGQLRRVMDPVVTHSVFNPGDIYLVVGPDPDPDHEESFCVLVNGHRLSWHSSSMERDPVVEEPNG